MINNQKKYTIGIDATNLRSGGGVTHLIELLFSADPKKHCFDKIIVWGGKGCLDLIEDRSWLVKKNPSALDKSLLQRVIWQSRKLSKAARNEGCDVLFVPGGSYSGNFRPVITMSQNLLPFEMPELLRFGWSFLTLKFLLLRWTQSRSFIRANGTIFLTEYACSVVSKVTGNLIGHSCIIPHGLSPRFNKIPKIQREVSEYNVSLPYRVLYISSVDQYKHQWHVVDAISLLREKGLPIALDLIGPAYKPALNRLNDRINSVDIERNWVRYLGTISFDELHHQYARADVGVFASSCENMPNILLEMMASGLPIACSDRGPMPEILLGGGVYFNPEQPKDIADALLKLIKSVLLRTELANESHSQSQKYSWQRCADETFAFIDEVIVKYKGQ